MKTLYSLKLGNISGSDRLVVLYEASEVAWCLLSTDNFVLPRSFMRPACRYTQVIIRELTTLRVGKSGIYIF